MENIREPKYIAIAKSCTVCKALHRHKKDVSVFVTRLVSGVCALLPAPVLYLQHSSGYA